MSTPKLKIKKFDPNSIVHRCLKGSPPTIAIIGRRGSGKSILSMDILFHINKIIGMFICMSGTEEGNEFYKNIMHPLCVHNNYSKAVVSGLIKKQKKTLKQLKEQNIDPSTRPDIINGLLLDDLGYDKKVMKENDIRMIFMNGRHWKIFFMVSLQYMMDISPDLRTNIDYVFVFRDNINVNQERLWKYYFGCFQKFSYFQEAFNACTDNYECMVLDNTSKSTKIEDCVFWYKANIRSNFKVGSPELWKYLDSRYKKNEEEDDDINPLPNKSGIIVRKDTKTKTIN